MNISIVIPVHNRIAFTRTCLESLQNQTDKNFSVIVVDDGSTDGTNEMVKKEYPHVHIIEGDGNLWWSKSVNEGIKFAISKGASHIITMNDDTFVDEHFVNTCVTILSSRGNDILGAVAIKQNTDEVIYCGARMIWWFDKSEKIYQGPYTKELPEYISVDFYIGRGLIVPTKVFNQIGFFDDVHFPQAMADEDLTRRAVKAGFKIFVATRLPVYMYDNENGGTQYIQKRSWKNYYSHLFSVKGGGNLKKVFYNGIKNAPRLYLLQYLFFGSMRRIFGYLIYWLFEILGIKTNKKAL